ncbi:MAG: glycoside hydrolase family 9 protein [Bacteroidales bacterium]
MKKSLFVAGLFLHTCTFANSGSGGSSIPVSTYIMVDQFGYRCYDKKTAVIVDPQQGFNAQDAFQPGNSYEVRRWADDSVVYRGVPVPWNNGMTDATSGDRGWWFDFSPVTTPGEYYIFDVEKGVRSYQFKIASDVYKEVLAAATRMYYYQREFTRKEAQYAGSAWTDEKWFPQDTVTRYVNDRNNAALYKDMRGGWMDAGDVNKYVTFCYQPIHQLLTAFEQNPDAFTDETNIPESGNGVPDILDEVRFEMEWMVRMQDPADGGVHIKMGNIDYYDAWPLSTDTRPRYYGPKCSSSSIAAAGMFAHASLVFSKVPGWEDLAAGLKERAMRAWAWYKTNPRSTNCDDGTIKSGDADWDLSYQDRAEVVAGIYLYMLTGENKYHDAVKANYTKTRPFTDVTWSMYDAPEGDALLLYTTLPSADLVVKNAILSRKSSQGKTSSIYFAGEDLYNAWVPLYSYHWGSLNPRANIGNANMDFIDYHIDTSDNQRYAERALNILHYFHGVNPFNMVYLSNMGNYGAERSVRKIYHAWYRFGTSLADNPAPGYVPGGPNKDYGGNLASLKNQPPQKCFLEFNDGWPANSWEITEPGIYYQSAYVKLLSHFIGENCQGNDSVALNVKNISLKQNASSRLKALIYPNPAVTECSVAFSDRIGGKLVQIFNCTGRMVYSSACEDCESISIPVAQLANDGSFFLIRIYAGSQLYYDKLTVIR